MRIASLSAAVLLLLAAACGEGPVTPPGDAGTADASLSDGGMADADGAAPAGDPAEATPPRPQPAPGHYVAEGDVYCGWIELFLHADGTFDSGDSASPCDHPIPVGGRYGFEHLPRLSYLRLHDPELARSLPSLGTRRYAYRLEGELLWLRDADGSVWFAFRRTAEAGALP
jgi:hypothetical protein